LKNIRINRLRVSAILATTIIATSLVATTPLNSAHAAAPKILKLLWSDEFNGKKGVLPSSKYWDYDIGNGYGWGNAELEYYTNKAANVATDGNGKLAITALRIADSSGNATLKSPATDLILNSCWECQFTSAKIKTSKKLGFLYGRLEARMKVAPGEGTWPAFWLLGADLLDGNPWPECGEIDISETRGIEPGMTSAKLHGPGYGKGGGAGDVYQTSTPLSDAYHVYAIEWKKDQVDFYIDDHLITTETPASFSPGRWVFNHEFFLILNLAMGGDFAGEIDPAVNKTQLMVDYIRFYSVNGIGKLIKH